MMNRQVASGAGYHVGQLLRVKLFLAVLYGVLVSATAWLAGVQQWRILLFVIATQVSLSFFTFFRSLITAHQLFRWDVWLSVLDKGLMLLLFLPLLYSQLFQTPISILFFVQAQFFCTAMATTVALLLVLQKGLLRSTAALQRGMHLLKSVAPYALIILLMSAHNRLDAFLLERLHPRGAYEAGVYAASYRLLDAANMLGFLVASFLVPFLARHRTNRSLMQQTIATTRFGLLLFGTWTALFFVLFAAPVQQLLYPQATAYTTVVLQWCLPVLPAYLLLHVYGSLLTALAQLKPFLLFLAAAVLLNVVLNLCLIPYWGAIGCCIAALVSQYACAISVWIVAAHKNKLRFESGSFVRLLATALLLAGLFYFGRPYAPPFLLAAMGGVLVLLALFAYLPQLKRSLILPG